MQQNEDGECFVLFADILGFAQLVENNLANEVARICDSEFRQTALTANLISNAKCANFGNLRFTVETSEQGHLRDIKQNQMNLHIMSDSLIAWTIDCSPESLLILSNFTAQFVALTAVLGLPIRGGISKGQIAVAELPLNGNMQRNVFGSGVVAAHRLEGLQNWMGCVVDDRCLASFPTAIANDLLTLPSSTLCRYEVPYKNRKASTPDVVVDWRSSLEELGLQVDYDFFFEKFNRYGKPVTESVEEKIRYTLNFYTDR